MYVCLYSVYVSVSVWRHCVVAVPAVQPVLWCVLHKVSAGCIQHPVCILPTTTAV